MRFYLLASTDYSISIKSVTITGEHSEHVSCVEFRTPSTINFSGDLEVKTHESNSTIFLNIPRVLNDTYDSVLHVIVNGPYPCEQYTKLPMNLQMQVGLKMKDIAWQAAEVSVCVQVYRYSDRLLLFVIFCYHEFILLQTNL